MHPHGLPERGMPTSTTPTHLPQQQLYESWRPHLAKRPHLCSCARRGQVCYKGKTATEMISHAAASLLGTLTAMVRYNTPF
jgi:hypothetical protein